VLPQKQACRPCRSVGVERRAPLKTSTKPPLMALPPSSTESALPHAMPTDVRRCGARHAVHGQTEHLQDSAAQISCGSVRTVVALTIQGQLLQTVKSAERAVCQRREPRPGRVTPCRFLPAPRRPMGLAHVLSFHPAETGAGGVVLVADRWPRHSDLAPSLSVLVARIPAIVATCAVERTVAAVSGSGFGSCRWWGRCCCGRPRRPWRRGRVRTR